MKRELSTDPHAVYMREYYWRKPEQRQKVLERARRWTAANKERAIAGSVKRNRQRRLEEPEAYKEMNRKHNLKRLGADGAIYTELMEKQGGLCRICGKTCTKRGYLCVDHCHKSGKIRGLLCLKCNAGLGMFSDELETMRAAVKYLEET